MKTTSSSLLCLSVGAELASSSNVTGEVVTELVDTEPAKKGKKYTVLSQWKPLLALIKLGGALDAIHIMVLSQR
jgi:hypothetical protein